MRRFTAAFLLLLLSETVSAQSASALHGALTAEGKRLQGWGRDAVILEAVRRQNSVPATMDAIQRIDPQWTDRQTCGTQEGNHLESVRGTSAPADDRRRAWRGFRHRRARRSRLCGAATSDYWQGDEPKFTNAFKDGRGAVFIDRPRYDEA